MAWCPTAWTVPRRLTPCRQTDRATSCQAEWPELGHAVPSFGHKAAHPCRLVLQEKIFRAEEWCVEARERCGEAWIGLRARSCLGACAQCSGCDSQWPGPGIMSVIDV